MQLSRDKLLTSALSACLLLCGCAGSSPAGDEGARADSVVDAGPVAVVMSDSEQLQIEVHTGPDQPPTRGVSVVELDISDAQSGDPVDGLALTVVPWMPAMGHGTSVKPQVEAMGDGVYLVSRVNMYMGGEWDLRTSISGTLVDHATLHFSIR